MKFTLSWLKAHLDTDKPLAEIAAKLTQLGLEVEKVEDRGAALGDFIVAQIVSAEQHPDADRLRVCEVDTGLDRVQVVCGAPNARAGLRTVFAAPGTVIPATGKALTVGTIRGVESRGMLCSERELGLGEEHNGIAELPADAPIGMRYADFAGLSDPVIEIGLTPDRVDCAGVRGIARDLAAAGMGTLRPDGAVPVPGSFPSPIRVEIDNNYDMYQTMQPGGLQGELCPLFVGRTIRGVRNGPSPRWLQDRLRAIGLRPISALVDITNYFSFDRCRPLHVFDAAKISGNAIVARSAADGETLAALNDKTYTLQPGMVAIADAAGVQGLGGVMGGAATGVSDATVDVFLEVALFDPIRTAQTGRALQIDSDARYRFERGIDPADALPSAERATRMILDLCGGEASDLVIAGAVPDWRRQIAFRPSRVAGLAGLEVALDEQERILTALGFTVTRSGEDSWVAEPPSWRADVHGEADLVEEVVRVVGLDAIPSVPLPRLEGREGAALSREQRQRNRVRRLLAERGLDEAVTWSFMAKAKAELFRAIPDTLVLLNPISSDLDAMRPSILPNLIDAAVRNANRGLRDLGLFEIGPVFAGIAPKDQRIVAAGLRSGDARGRHWAEAARPVDAYDAKADALAVLELLEAPVANLQVTPDAPGWYHPGRSASLRLGANVLAHFGEIHPAIAAALDAEMPLVGFEIHLSAVPQPKKAPTTARPPLQLNPLQAVKRDFAFQVAVDVTADRIVRAARGADKALIVDATVFDVYTGTHVEPGQKSVALAVTIQPQDRTLTDVEIEAIGARVVEAVAKATNATVR